MKKASDTAEVVKPRAKPAKAPAKHRAKAPPKEKKPHGRPTKRTQAIEDEIIQRISEGEPLRQICRDPHMPNYSTVYDWINEKKSDGSPSDLSQRFAHAREKGEDAIAEECLEIADNATNDWMEKFDRDGMSVGYSINGEHVQRSKLRVETRLKLLAKWNPKKYGDKLGVEHDVPPDSPLAKLYEQMAGTPLRPASEDGDK